MKLRNKVFLSWLALELAALPLAIPAFATFKDRVSFTIPQHAVVTQIPATAGETKFLVASNGPFAVVSKGVIANMQVDISVSGQAAGTTYGTKAQSPGIMNACNFPNSIRPTRIYTAQDKTASRRGNPMEQAVLVTITYDASLSPDLSIDTMESLSQRRVLLALPCDIQNS